MLLTDLGVVDGASNCAHVPTLRIAASGDHHRRARKPSPGGTLRAISKQPVDSRGGWRTATRIGVGLGAFLLVVLAASGVWLWWNYRPDRDQWIRTTHAVASVALLAVAVVLVVVAILRRARTGASGIVAAVGVFATVGASYVTGRLLPWDQFALWAVIAGKDMQYGVAGTFDDRLKFLIVRSREVSIGTYHFWAVSHVVLGALVALTLLLVWLRVRARSSGTEVDDDADAPS